MTAPAAGSDANSLLATLFTVVTILSLGLITVSGILQLRYMRPYTLANTPNRERWRKSALLAVLGVTPFFLIFAFIIVSAWNMGASELAPGFFSFWFVVYLISFLYTRWGFERQHKSYLKLDKWIKDGTYDRIFKGKIFGLTDVFMSEEQKRFMKEGFPEPDQPAKSES